MLFIAAALWIFWRLAKDKQRSLTRWTDHFWPAPMRLVETFGQHAVDGKTQRGPCAFDGRGGACRRADNRRNPPQRGSMSVHSPEVTG